MPFAHVGGRFLSVFFFSFTAFAFIPSVSAGFSANQESNTLALQKTDELPISQHHSKSAPFFFLSLPIPFLFSAICSLASSFSLINSLIKDTTSKSQLQGLCLSAWRRFPPPSPPLHSSPPPRPQLLPTLVHLYHRQ